MKQTLDITNYKQCGFTLIELVLVLAVISITSKIAYSSYREVIDKMKIDAAITDIYEIDLQITRYHSIKNQYPANLSELDIPVDPWGNAYQYLNMSLTNGNGGKRKDRNLVPINSDYDLYSSGPDGRSVSPLTAKHSRDDIIRARNGGFVGKAESF